MKWLLQCKYTYAEFLNVFKKMNSIKKFNVYKLIKYKRNKVDKHFVPNSTQFRKNYFKYYKILSNHRKGNCYNVLYTSFSINKSIKDIGT